MEIESNEISFHTLSTLFVNKQSIQSISLVIFAKDISGNVVYLPTELLSERQVKHGEELFVLGKFEEIVVDKAFVNE